MRCNSVRSVNSAKAWRAALADVTIAGMVATVGETGSPAHLGEMLQWYGASVRVLPSAG